MELQEAVSRLKNFCKEVQDVKERECEAKYDVEAIETVLQELEKSQKRVEELEIHVIEDCSKCPYSPKFKEAMAVASMPVMQKVTKEATNPILDAIKKAVEDSINVNPINIGTNTSENIMKGGMM